MKTLREIAEYPSCLILICCFILVNLSLHNCASVRVHEELIERLDRIESNTQQEKSND